MKKLLLLTLVAFLPVANSQTTPQSASDKKPKTISLKTGEPELITYDAGTVRYLATAGDTNGAWSLVELTEKPGYKTRLHRHNYTDEAYYVLEGVLTARIADKTRGRSQGDLRLSGQAAQTAEARAAFTMWAGYLREALDDARKAARNTP